MQQLFMAKNREQDALRQMFGQRLKLARQDRGYKSAAMFAKALGMEASTYREWERGINEPGLLKLAEIARALGDSLDYLILGRRHLPSPPPSAFQESPAMNERRIRSMSKAARRQ